jgi:hypothetical protein
MPESKTFGWCRHQRTTELESRGVRLYNTQGEIRENTALMKTTDQRRAPAVWVNPRGGWSGNRCAGDGQAGTLLWYGGDGRLPL